MLCVRDKLEAFPARSVGQVGGSFQANRAVGSRESKNVRNRPQTFPVRCMHETGSGRLIGFARTAANGSEAPAARRNHAGHPSGIGDR